MENEFNTLFLIFWFLCIWHCGTLFHTIFNWEVNVLQSYFYYKWRYLNSLLPHLLKICFVLKNIFLLLTLNYWYQRTEFSSCIQKVFLLIVSNIYRFSKNCLINVLLIFNTWSDPDCQCRSHIQCVSYFSKNIRFFLKNSVLETIFSVNFNVPKLYLLKFRMYKTRKGT